MEYTDILSAHSYTYNHTHFYKQNTTKVTNKLYHYSKPDHYVLICMSTNIQLMFPLCPSTFITDTSWLWRVTETIRGLPARVGSCCCKNLRHDCIETVSCNITLWLLSKCGVRFELLVLLFNIVRLQNQNQRLVSILGFIKQMHFISSQQNVPPLKQTRVRQLISVPFCL